MQARRLTDAVYDTEYVAESAVLLGKYAIPKVAYALNHFEQEAFAKQHEIEADMNNKNPCPK